jgi:hypothetical protein
MQFFRYPRGQREQGVFLRFVKRLPTICLNYLMQNNLS